DVVQHSSSAWLCYAAVSAPSVSAYAVWDAANKGSSITLSVTDHKATDGGAFGGVIGTIGRSSGKVYCEFTLGGLSQNNTSVGIAIAGMNFNTNTVNQYAGASA